MNNSCTFNIQKIPIFHWQLRMVEMSPGWLAVG